MAPLPCVYRLGEQKVESMEASFSLCNSEQTSRQSRTMTDFTLVQPLVRPKNDRVRSRIGYQKGS